MRFHFRTFQTADRMEYRAICHRAIAWGPRPTEMAPITE